MRHNQQLDEVILEQAAHWVVRLDNFALGDVEREEFHKWLLADPHHEEAFLAVGCIAAAAAELPEDERSQLLSRDIAPTVNPAPRRTRWLALAAATLVGVVATGWLVMSSSGLMSETFVTDTGEMRTVHFEDGSVAYMNTLTRLEWLGSKTQRRVALLEGEVLFDVVHDETRPFRVELENSEVQVRGTHFNVYRKKNEEVIVTVLEGTVDVLELNQGSKGVAWKRELHAGERIVYRPIGLIRDVHATDALSAVKWREGVLQLEGEALEDVLNELTRYTEHRIVIRDPRIARIRVGGVLSTRDVGAALNQVAKLHPSIQVKDTGQQFELSMRAGFQPPAVDP